MARFFDEAKWSELIRKPDWYIALYPELETLRKRWETEPDAARADAVKEEVRNFFETHLQDGTLSLADSGPNLDARRRPIDTIVIHHTSSRPGYRLPRLNAVQMLNVYVPYFNDPTDETERDLKGQPLWSNHVRSSRPVFYLYHWLMRMDGSFERLLEDGELGWHAANWDINCRSVAICLDNDYEHQDPGQELLAGLAKFIARQYPSVPAGRIFGHKEVSRHKTICPGTNFTDGWKSELVRLAAGT